MAGSPSLALGGGRGVVIIWELQQMILIVSDLFKLSILPVGSVFPTRPLYDRKMEHNGNLDRKSYSQDFKQK